ncbi:autotransporter outer membrane beta-barrel domain-containing protein [Hydrogenimonas cancrithermarum]|uniref:Outer membrane protein beta-barrel domain-containing protein n=1 Tax=Hydrogenimonas cancrithermarum TaxID=2993563 RepID=A0ABN6WWG7_9BACT|nr:autotransporter outer membrane beta-barrel domain-containing protein [Hydrogenimonas cancrithermarum]BDY13461.1 hypothetical protein HCR_17730 [Hydrogenimonas cancrithermarum]
MNRMKIMALIALLHTSLFAHDIYIGGQMVNFDYEERDANGDYLDGETSGFSDITGFETALRLDFEPIRHETARPYLKLLFSYARGSSDYDGFVSDGSGATPYRGTTDVEIYTGEIRLAAEEARSDYAMRAFMGAGYRHWQRNLDNHDGYGYDEAYKWPYLLIGLGTRWSPVPAWSIGASVHYQHAIAPKLDASLDGGVTLDLGTTNGFHLDIPLTWNVTRQFYLQGNYAYDYWDIDESEAAYGSSGQGYIEPRSTTKNQIVSLRIGYVF